MRNASEPSETPVREIRATFVVPEPLYEAFKTAARAKDQTFSQEMRRFMREYLEEQAA